MIHFPSVFSISPYSVFGIPEHASVQTPVAILKHSHLEGDPRHQIRWGLFLLQGLVWEEAEQRAVAALSLIFGICARPLLPGRVLGSCQV